MSGDAVQGARGARFEVWRLRDEKPVRLEGGAPSFDAAMYYAEYLIEQYGEPMMIADRHLVTDTTVAYQAQADAARVWPKRKAVAS